MNVSIGVINPFTLFQGLKARNFIHSKIEENIKKKVQESDKESQHGDALQQLIDSSRKNGEPFSMQVLRPSPLTLWLKCPYCKSLWINASAK